MIHGDGGHAAVIISFYLGYEGSIVAIGDNAARKREVERLTKEGWIWGKAIHPSALVSELAWVCEGAVIMAGAIVQPHAYIGPHAIVNTGATVDHHCHIGAYAHIAPGAHLCGNVTVGEGALVGVGVGVAPVTTIPAWHIAKARRLEIEPL